MNGRGEVRLAVENAFLNYGDLAVLADVSLDVGSSEIVSVGSSGCGKTKLLRCVGGLNRLDGGRIRIDGQLATGRCRACNAKFLRVLPYRPEAPGRKRPRAFKAREAADPGHSMRPPSPPQEAPCPARTESPASGASPCGVYRSDATSLP
jgi:energy-coupling factor transporter ATP-binding protein EcfA2